MSELTQSAANSMTAPTDFSIDGNYTGAVYDSDVLATYALAEDLSHKSSIANNVASALEAFKSAARGGKLSGNGYESMLIKLELYEFAFRKLGKLCDVLGNNILTSDNTYLNDYIYNNNPFGNYADYALLAGLQEELRITEACYNSDMELVLKGYGNEAYWDHRNAAHAAQDATKMEELRRKINFLQLLPEKDNHAISFVEDIQGECSTFANQVNQIQVSTVKTFSSTR